MSICLKLVVNQFQFPTSLTLWNCPLSLHWAWLSVSDASHLLFMHRPLNLAVLHKAQDPGTWPWEAEMWDFQLPRHLCCLFSCLTGTLNLQRNTSKCFPTSISSQKHTNQMPVEAWPANVKRLHRQNMLIKLSCVCIFPWMQLLCLFCSLVTFFSLVKNKCFTLEQKVVNYIQF